MYSTATREGLLPRVPDVPFSMETFRMGDHGIASSYRPEYGRKGRDVALSLVRSCSLRGLR
jgi:hypothetical protein